MKKLMVLLLMILLLAGCNTQRQAAEPLAPLVPPTEKPASEPAGTEKPKEADWTLQVDDSIEMNIEGIKIKYTLTLNAIKQGGTTDVGIYTGTADLTQKMDATGLSKQMVQVTGGVETNLRDDNAKIEIVTFDREKYDDFGNADGEPPVSLLSEADGMALGAFMMSGKGEGTVSAFAPFISRSVALGGDGTGKMAYKINIEGGQVTVSIPMLGLPDSFHGMITGVLR